MNVVYVFDTDVLSLLMRDRLPPPALERMRRVPEERARTTAITLGELHYGAVRSAAPARWLLLIEEVFSRISCLPFDQHAARRYGELRSWLERKGRRLDDADLRIASICLAEDLILVTGNSRHFARVPRLRWENWLAPS